jgi:phosphoribosylamine--glycine ligase
MNILLLGSGGREHAFAWKLAQSKHLNRLFIAPGNPGTAKFGENVNINPLDFEAVKQFVSEHNVSIVVVGPEEPLVKGISDAFSASDAHRSVTVIGPSAAGAQLEGSKDFSKAFMMRHQIPTARYQSFTPATLDEGKAFLRTMEAPFVLKASGLAAGKGVVIPETLEEAQQELEEMLGGTFGAAGNVVVIEEFLKGVECSVFVLSDGSSAFLLPEAKDHKRIGEGNTGLNTGGMGAFSPVPFCDEVFMDKVKSRIIEPTMNGLKARKKTVRFKK